MQGIIGSFQLSESDFPSLNSSGLGSLSSACARRVARSAASARVCLGSSSLAVSVAVAHSHSSILHGAWNSGGTGGLLPVLSSQGPTDTRRIKGGVSGLSERWRQGQIFGRPAVYAGILQVHFPEGNQAQVPGR